VQHKDFKKLSQYALSCVVNLDFKNARLSFIDLLAMSPDNAAVLYNLACIESLTHHVESSLELVRLALENGYSHIDKLNSDPDLARVRAMPEFQELVKEHKKAHKLLSPRLLSPRKTT